VLVIMILRWSIGMFSMIRFGSFWMLWSLRRTMCDGGRRVKRWRGKEEGVRRREKRE